MFHLETKADDEKKHLWEDLREDPPITVAIWTYISLIILRVVGSVRDFCMRIGLEKIKAYAEPEIPGYVLLYGDSWTSFFFRHLYRRGSQTSSRPVTGVAGATIDILERKSDDYGWTYKFTGKILRNVINIGSYNYLGMSQSDGPCADQVEKTTFNVGHAFCGSRQELGYHEIHKELEDLVAEYLGVEAAITIPLGFSTNSMNLPCLVQKGCLILSDQLNHASLVLGARLSGAQIDIFKHNDMEDLEQKLRSAILKGQPKRNRPWKKILIVVEGVYSMEGTIVRLPEVVRLKNKYGAYLYIDEAHSIGAIGPNGKGVTDYFGMDPKQVDVLMGTFSKSFGATGGYIAGNRNLVKHLRVHSHSSVYSPTMNACVVRHVISSMKIIMGKDNTNKGKRIIEKLRWNNGYFRQRLRSLGFITYGNVNSSIVPILVYKPAKLVAFSDECLKRGLAIVVVCFPATHLAKCRARICLSAAHSKEQLDTALDIISEVGDLIGLKYSRKPVKTVFEEENQHIHKLMS